MTRASALLLVVGLLVALGLAALSPLASKNPDGLEHVSEKHGIAPETSDERRAPIPNYWEDEGAAKKIVAGVLGTLLVFGLTLGLGAALRKRGARGGSSSSSGT
jgi:hypothetical protein